MWVETSIGQSVVRVTGDSFWYVLLIGVVLNETLIIIGLGVYLAKLESTGKSFLYLLARVISTSTSLTQQKVRLFEWYGLSQL
jgi:hypothetical protein